MAKPEPTLQEHLYFSRNGKLAPSFIKRREEWEKDQKPEEKSEEGEFESLPDDTEFPYHKGSGWYFLSDGSKVRGEKAAEKAQAQLEG